MNANAVTISSEKAGEIIEAVIAKGDLGQLNPTERAKFYARVCESIGLNPLTKPFEYITLNGKLVLYARKDATDQLRKRYGVSVTDLIESERDGVFVVTAKVRDATGREDAAKGAVSIGGLRGEALANALMKAETKAKRRATLSICGLGFLDETELDTIPTATYSKAQARDEYSALQAEIENHLGPEEKFRQWMQENDGRIRMQPHDWQRRLRIQCQEKLVSLRAPPSEDAPVVTDITSDHNPQTGEVLWTDADEPPVAEPDTKSGWDTLGPIKQAGILCSKLDFNAFCQQKADRDGIDFTDATNFVRDFCGVKSRAELATKHEARVLWHGLVEQYRGWQREPAVVDPPQDQQPASTPATVAGPAGAPSPPAPAGKLPPTGAEYVAVWNERIASLTPGTADAMERKWIAQAGMRPTVRWDDDQQWPDLERRFKRALADVRR